MASERFDEVQMVRQDTARNICLGIDFVTGALSNVRS